MGCGRGGEFIFYFLFFLALCTCPFTNIHVYGHGVHNHALTLLTLLIHGNGASNSRPCPGSSPSCMPCSMDASVSTGTWAPLQPSTSSQPCNGQETVKEGRKGAAYAKEGREQHMLARSMARDWSTIMSKATSKARSKVTQETNQAAPSCNPHSDMCCCPQKQRAPAARDVCHLGSRSAQPHAR